MISCTSPLHCFTIGYDRDGKPIKEITSNRFIEYKGSFKYTEVPCGHCLACRLSRSREWANRCMLELRYHSSSYFVTLTYDDDHLPLQEYVTSDGEICHSAVLCKRDLQLFFKRLRKRFPDSGIRYYACGEYGSQTMRPHYHAVIFGLELDDLKLYKQSRLGDNYYNSATLDKIWKKGFAVIGEVTWDSCAYTARYIVKKKLGKDAADWYKQHHLEPEFNTMSLKPAIGRRYYDDHSDTIFDSMYMYLPQRDGCRQITAPYYYKKLQKQFDEHAFDSLESINRNHTRTKRGIVAGILNPDKYQDWQDRQNLNLEAKTRALARKEI